MKLFNIEWLHILCALLDLVEWIVGFNSDCFLEQGLFSLLYHISHAELSSEVFCLGKEDLIVRNLLDLLLSLGNRYRSWSFFLFTLTLFPAIDVGFTSAVAHRHARNV